MEFPVKMPCDGCLGWVSIIYTFRQYLAKRIWDVVSISCIYIMYESKYKTLLEINNYRLFITFNMLYVFFPTFNRKLSSLAPKYIKYSLWKMFIIYSRFSLFLKYWIGIFLSISLNYIILISKVFFNFLIPIR